MLRGIPRTVIAKSNGQVWVDGVATAERGTITIDGYKFFVKKVDWFFNETVYFSMKDTNFEFKNFKSMNVTSTNNIIGGTGYAAMTKIGNKIWISDFVDSPEASYEYSALIKAAVASQVTDWYRDKPDEEQTVEVSRFVPLCCDIPEVAEISFVLWYVF